MKQSLKLAGASLFLMALGLSTAAIAHPPHGDGESRGERPDMFAEADLNGDGVITADERTTVKAEKFDLLDTDGNGVVSDAEMEAAHEARRAEMEGRREAMSERFSERRENMAERGEERRADIDTNSDGAISRAEFIAHEPPHFDDVDADGDGNITREEAEAARTAMHDKKRRGWRDRSGD